MSPPPAPAVVPTAAVHEPVFSFAEAKVETPVPDTLPAPVVFALPAQAAPFVFGGGGGDDADILPASVLSALPAPAAPPKAVQTDICLACEKPIGPAKDHRYLHAGAGPLHAHCLSAASLSCKHRENTKAHEPDPEPCTFCRLLSRSAASDMNVRAFVAAEHRATYGLVVPAPDEPMSSSPVGLVAEALNAVRTLGKSSKSDPMDFTRLRTVLCAFCNMAIGSSEERRYLTSVSSSPVLHAHCMKDCFEECKDLPAKHGHVACRLCRMLGNYHAPEVDAFTNADYSALRGYAIESNPNPSPVPLSSRVMYKATRITAQDGYGASSSALV